MWHWVWHPMVAVCFWVWRKHADLADHGAGSEQLLQIRDSQLGDDQIRKPVRALAFSHQVSPAAKLRRFI